MKVVTVPIFTVTQREDWPGVPKPSQRSFRRSKLMTKVCKGKTSLVGAGLNKQHGHEGLL